MRALGSVAAIVTMLGVAVTSPGCTRNDDPGTAAYWIDRLDRYETRTDALETLGKLGDRKAVPTILTWLEKDGDWQPDAAYALGRIGDRSVVPRLVAALSFGSAASTDARGRHASRLNIAVVRALAMLHATGAGPSIVRVLGSGDDRVREAALHALGDLGDPANTPTLVRFASDEKDPIVRLAAIQALGDLGDAQGADALVELLFHDTREYSFYEPARFSLLQIGRPAVPLLISTLRRQNPAVEALKLPDGSPVGEGAIEARAASVLGILRAPEAAEPVAAALGKLYERARKKGAPRSTHYAVIELAYALGNIGGPRAVGALLPIARDLDPNLRTAACEALTTVGDHEVAPQLLAIARTGAAAARWPAIVAASRLGTGDDLIGLDALARAGDRKVPAATMAKMVAAERSRLVAASECGTTVDCWRRKTADADANVRERASYELGWLGAKAAASDLLETVADRNVEVRMAAVVSLMRLGGVSPQKLEAIYEASKDRREYAATNQELRHLIALSKGAERASAGHPGRGASL